MKKIGYELEPLDIVMLMAGRDKHLGNPEHFLQPALTRASVLWLCDQGIKVIGIDAYSLDRNFEATTRGFPRLWRPTKFGVAFPERATERPTTSRRCGCSPPSSR